MTAPDRAQTGRERLSFLSSLKSRLLGLALCCLLPAVVIVWQDGSALPFRSALFASLLITALGLLIGWLGSELLVMRSVRKLIETSKLLIAGDLRARTGFSGERSEFGQLGRVMDDLAEALDRRTVEIQAAERSIAESERRLAAQQGVAKTLGESESLEETASSVLRFVCLGFGWDLGLLWVVDPAQSVLRCAGVWAFSGLEADPLVAMSREAVLRPGEWRPGRVWASGESRIEAITTAVGPPKRAECAAAAGLRSSIAFPIMGGPELAGVLEGFSKRDLSDRDVPSEAVSAVTREIGEFLVRGRSARIQARLLGIVEATTDLVGFSSADGQILYINRAGRKMFGMGEAENVSTTRIADYYDAENGRFVAETALPIAMREGVWRGEFTMRGPRENRSLRISAVIMAHRGTNGEIDYLSIIGRDITERMKLEEQLRQSQKMEAVGSLAGGIAHDFNNLLTAIQGFSDLAMTRLTNPEALKRDLDEVRKASVRAAALTRQLLIFSRQQVLQPRPIDLNLLVGELGKMLRRLIGEDIELTTNCGQPPATILADPGQIEQVIINLVVNARDAMPDGGELIVETSIVEIDTSYASIRPKLRPGSYAMLAVTDTGTGMDEATRARIFEPFFTTKEAGRGTGLGLATVYAIVEQCAGDIHVYSEPGEGTTFKILIPRTGATEETRLPEAGGSASRGGSETILVVEDEEAVRSLVRHSLSEYGYTVHVAGDGVEAMAVQESVSGRIDLVLCDMVMPVMNGPDVVARLLHARPDIKVLFMSGYAEKSVLRRGLAHGAAFLHKPFGTAALVSKVREVLDGAASRSSDGPAAR